jgi:hypothetical protein
MKMKTSKEILDDLEMQVFRSIAKEHTMKLLELYVQGLGLKKEADAADRGVVALQINHVLDEMPAAMKDAVIIELMSSLTEAVGMMKQIGLKME